MTAQVCACICLFMQTAVALFFYIDYGKEPCMRRLRFYFRIIRNLHCFKKTERKETLHFFIIDTWELAVVF
jgi:hypothetical protein